MVGEREKKECSTQPDGMFIIINIYVYFNVVHTNAIYKYE